MSCCSFSLRLCLIFSGKARAERCERGPVSCRNQSSGCLRFTTQLLASLRPAPLLLFPTTEARGSVACPSVILIASGTVATSVGDELGRLVTEKKGRSDDPFQSRGRDPSPHIYLASHPEQVVSAPQAGCSICDNTSR